MCVDFQSKLSGVTNMRQEFMVCQIKATFQLCVDFHYFPLILPKSCWRDIVVFPQGEFSWLERCEQVKSVFCIRVGSCALLLLTLWILWLLPLLLAVLSVRLDCVDPSPFFWLDTTYVCSPHDWFSAWFPPLSCVVYLFELLSSNLAGALSKVPLLAAVNPLFECARVVVHL